jgi:hypothetical protein
MYGKGGFETPKGGIEQEGTEITESMGYSKMVRNELERWRNDMKCQVLCFLRYLLFQRFETETPKGGIEQEGTEITESMGYSKKVRNELERWRNDMKCQVLCFLRYLLFKQPDAVKGHMTPV